MSDRRRNAMEPQGDPERHLPLNALERGLAALARPPTDQGHVVLIVRRGEAGKRETPKRVNLTPDGGVPGDAWNRDAARDPERQLAVMRADVATLIANGQPLTLFGDNLLVDLDVSAENLPPGSLLQVGGAALEVTAMPHNGCWKFAGRFGQEALRFISRPDLGNRHLRGIYLRVVERGVVKVGDPIEVRSRN